VQRLGVVFARPPSRISLPRKGCRVGLHIVLFEACSAFTRVAACTLAQSPIRDTLSEGFSHFVTSMTAPAASGWSELPGGPRTHWNIVAFHGAHPKRSLPGAAMNMPLRPDPSRGPFAPLAEANIGV
jgi:inhibitor of KinA sporulation pathway (predicted exonuclease)